MTTRAQAGVVVTGSIHIGRMGRGARKEIRTGPAPATLEPGRVPRVARLMALAIHFDGLVRKGVVRDYAELARLGHVTRARITQIMNLLHLAPDIQEAVLHLPRITTGRELIALRDLLPMAAIIDWPRQRKFWIMLSS